MRAKPAIWPLPYSVAGLIVIIVSVASSGCASSTPEAQWVSRFVIAHEQGDDQEVSNAIQDLTLLGNQSIPEFIAILGTDPAPKRRCAAAVALGKLKGMQTSRIDALVRAGCTDQDRLVQLAALGAINHLRDALTDPQLEQLCNLIGITNDTLVADYALVIIRENADRCQLAIPALKDIVAYKRFNSNTTRHLALEALVRCDPNDTAIQDIAITCISDMSISGIDVAVELRTYLGDKAPLAVAEIAKVAASSSQEPLYGRIRAIEAISKFSQYVNPS